MIVYNINILIDCLWELVFLNKGFKIMVEDCWEGKEKQEFFYYEGGICYYVEFFNEGYELFFDLLIYVEGEYKGIMVEVFL